MRFQGLNINAISLTKQERSWLIGILKSMDAISHTTMDDYSYTLECAEAMPNTLFAHRSWNPFGASDDTGTYEVATPEQWASRVNNFSKHDNVLHHMLNEPNVNNVPKLVDWLIETMDLTGRNGKYPTRCVVGNFAVDKSFQHMGDTIRWQDDWLRLFKAFERHKNWHMLGIHRYWIGDVRLAYVDGYPANIKLDYPTHADYMNPDKHRLSLDRLPNGQLPPHWTGYADLWIKQICIEHGIELPDEMETEGIHDEKRDSGSNVFNQYVDENYPTEYNDGRGRGLWTWRKWSEASSGKPYLVQLKDQFIARNTVHKQLETDYPQLKGKQKGAHLFSFTKSADWERGGFSVYTPQDAGGKYAERLQLLIVMSDMPEFNSQEQPDMPEPIVFDPPLYEDRVRVKSGVWNLRADMTTNSKSLGYLTTEYTDMQVSRATNPANGYDWYKFKINTVPGVISGYFASAEKIEFASIVEPAPDIPDNEPTPEPDTPDSDLPEFEDMIQEALAPTLAELVAFKEQLSETVLVDIPLPDFTMHIPAILRDYLVSYHRAQAKLHEAIARRVESGTPTASQFADAGYKPTVAGGFDTQSVFSNVSVDSTLGELIELNTENTLTDEIMNGSVDSEGKPDAA